MNKYIRTKDGRIIDLMNLIKKNKTQGLDLDEVMFWNQAYRYPEKHKMGLERRILKQADTIEELCDEFIIKHNYNTVLPYEIVNSLKPILNGMKVYIDEFKKSDIYGAIWTDKGLIYKAKMKGILPTGETEWELL